MGLYDAIDFGFSRDGDFTIGEDGDWGDTSSDYLLSLENQLRDLVKSAQGDWESDPNFAADLDDFIGEKNSRDTGKIIEERVRSRILTSRLVSDRDLLVRAVPIHVHQIAVFIKVNCNVTPNNRLKFGESIIVTAVYDTIEKGIFFQLPNTVNKEPF